MMDEQLAALIARIHDAPPLACVAITGAGAQGLGWLLSVPGGSRTLLEAVVPYSRPAFDDYLGFAPTQYASREAALALAARAVRRARELAPDATTPLLGLGCAAAIAAVPPRRGSHRASIAVWGPNDATVYDLTLAKGRRPRAGEEQVVSRLIVQALATACGLPHEPLFLDPDEPLAVSQIPLGQATQALLTGATPLVLLHPDGRLTHEGGAQRLVLSGSFNPLHHGHRRLAAVAAQLVGAQPCFELAARNADKPTIAAPELLWRLSQFGGYAPVAATAAPLFVDKARLFPGATFVVGSDTAARLVHERYYGSIRALHAAFEAIRATGCRFLVAGRLVGERWTTLDDIALPPAVRDLFAAIPTELFREDVSSTALRAAALEQHNP